MRRIVAVLVAVVALVLGLTGPAYADSTTVAGVSDIKKMYVNNGVGAVVVKVYGAGGKCAIRYVAATMKGRDGTTYKATGGCYPGGTWIKSLEKGTKLVPCSDYTLRYNVAGKFWRFSIPRTCLPRLPDKIKVSGEMTQSAVPGAAGPTTLLARG